MLSLNAFYYWTFSILKRVRSQDIPKFASVVLMAGFQMLNFYSVLMLVMFGMGYSYVPYDLRFFFLVLLLILIGLNYLSFYKRTDEIVARFRTMKASRLNWSRFFYMVYIIGTFVLFLFLLSHIEKPKENPLINHFNELR